MNCNDNHSQTMIVQDESEKLTRIRKGSKVLLNMADFHRFCRWKSFTLGLITGLMSGVDGSSVQAQVTKPSVVATTSILCDVTRQIVQETIALTCLLQPGADPHLYSASPQDRKAIEGASLILYAGYNFEPNLIRLIQASPNQAVKVAVSEKAVPNPITAGHSHNHAGEQQCSRSPCVSQR
jgi:ABC-type Zn uptake system ZnuABC Zn-binding protein ZnuA